MRKAHRLGLLDGAVVAIGNAPTALLEMVRLVREEGRAAGARDRRAGRASCRRRSRRKRRIASTDAVHRRATGAKAEAPSPWPSFTRCCCSPTERGREPAPRNHGHRHRRRRVQGAHEPRHERHRRAHRVLVGRRAAARVLSRVQRRAHRPQERPRRGARTHCRARRASTTSACSRRATACSSASARWSIAKCGAEHVEVIPQPSSVAVGVRARRAQAGRRRCHVAPRSAARGIPHAAQAASPRWPCSPTTRTRRRAWPRTCSSTAKTAWTRLGVRKPRRAGRARREASRSPSCARARTSAR